MLFKHPLRRFMMSADDNGSAGTEDRGDDFVPTEPEPAEEPAEEVVEESPAEETERPRDETGKFTKKERDDGPLIPKARFDEQLSKERAAREAAERRAAELEASVTKVNRDLNVEKAVAEVATLRKEERKALLDGDEDKAAALSTRADLLNRQIAIAESGQMTGQAKDQALEDMRMEMTIERMEDKYPVLNANSDEYSQDLVDDILDKQSGLMQRERLSPSKALAKAVESVMARQNTPAPAADRAGLAAAKPGETRKTAAIAKNIDAAARQPGSMKNSGVDSDKAGQTRAIPSASDMSFEEFSSLSEADIAKMRGDFV
jgi:hypothetical protein